MASDTVYVSNFGAGTVSVINGATCNAMVRSGCGQTAVSVPVGDNPVGLFADPDNHTVYVPNVGDTAVSMIDSANCNATDPAGCPSTPPPTVDVGANPTSAEADLDDAHGVCTRRSAPRMAGRCSKRHVQRDGAERAVARQGALAGDPSGPNDAEIDTGDDTLYTANFDNTVSAFDLSHCNAADLDGCATQTAGVVTPFPDPGFGENTVWVAVDSGTSYRVRGVLDSDDVLVAIDTNVCNGAHPVGLRDARPADDPHGRAYRRGSVLDARTQTLYIADELGNDVSVIDATRCNAQITLGCRHRPPAVALAAPGGVAVDGIEHTAYVTTASDSVALIDTRRLQRPPSRNGCAATPATVPAGDTPVAVAVSRPPHTRCTSPTAERAAAGTVSVFDARACAAADPAGCATLSTLTVPGGHPDDLALNPADRHRCTSPRSPASGPDLVTVFNGATCNATDAGGCGQTPATLAVGDSGDAPGNSSLNIAVNPETNTIYASNVFNFFGPPPFLGNTVYVINGAICDAINTTGCSQTPATVTIATNPPVGSNPLGIAVDQATDTIYTANIADGETAAPSR